MENKHGCLGYYQSMVHPDTKAGNFKERIWKVSPIGEKQMTTWRFSLTRSRNQLSVFSGVGGSRGHSLFMIGASSVTISPWFQDQNVKSNLDENLFILAEDLRGQSRGEDIVDILKEAFLLDVLVGEEEGGLVPIYPTVSEENLTRKIYLATQQQLSILLSNLR